MNYELHSNKQKLEEFKNNMILMQDMKDMVEKKAANLVSAGIRMGYMELFG